MATLAAGEISNVAAAELLTVRWLLETSATGCWKKKTLTESFPPLFPQFAHKMSYKSIYYSDKYYDDKYEYR